MEVAMTLDLAELTIRSALFRKETRGHHIRSDFPETSEKPQHTLAKKKDQDIEVAYKPIRKFH
jgi:succinate dehydrogenase/fumarate reductase flavoprotein subunit